MDTPVADTSPATAAPPAPFVPEPLPPSAYADPSRARRAVALDYPVVLDGVTWSAVFVRRFTVDQVATVVRNWMGAQQADPDAPLAFPSFVDAQGVEVPEAVIRLLDDDDLQALRKVAQGFLPRRFRPDPETTGESPSASASSTGAPTAA